MQDAIEQPRERAIMEKTQIAILGATSHIAKGLIHNFLRGGTSRLHLYTMSPDAARAFLAKLGIPGGNDVAIHEGYGDFRRHPYDVIVNCVGVGTRKKLADDFTKYFTVIEEYDNLAISSLRHENPDALYVGFSSGAVYGGDFSSPMQENTEHRIRVNHVDKRDYYSIVRLNSEAKHRAFRDLKIVDLRVFAYFSRFLDWTDGYFISDVIDCVLHHKTLTTGNVNFVRDYVHPQDLFALVVKCMEAGRINEAFDATSAQPVEKREILDYFSAAYGLQYVTDPSVNQRSTTGAKQIYYSTYRKAAQIGYQPQFRALDAIVQEAKYILRKGTP
jgi:nucleoside-diphosphate-sugar epimerase